VGTESHGSFPKETREKIAGLRENGGRGYFFMEKPRIRDSFPADKEIIMKRYAVLLALGLSLLLVQAAAAELVVNGGFENGDLSGWAYTGAPYTPTPPYWYAWVDTDEPHSGIYYGGFGEVGAMGVLSQVIPTTIGVSYNVSFWLWSGDTFPNEFEAKWDGITMIHLYDIPQGGSPIKDSYINYQFTEVASNTFTVLSFGLRNDGSWLYMDDISVNQVPIPGAVWLLGSGLLGLAGLRRKFKS
jgi:hypothetical protein